MATATRQERFAALATHAWLGRAYKQLKPDEMTLAREFIAAHDALDRGAFEMAVNRMFLDRPKPRHWCQIMELLSCANG